MNQRRAILLGCGLGVAYTGLELAGVGPIGRSLGRLTPEEISDALWKVDIPSAYVDLKSDTTIVLLVEANNDNRNFYVGLHRYLDEVLSLGRIFMTTVLDKASADPSYEALKIYSAIAGRQFVVTQEQYLARDDIQYSALKRRFSVYGIEDYDLFHDATAVQIYDEGQGSKLTEIDPTSQHCNLSKQEAFEYFCGLRVLHSQLKRSHVSKEFFAGAETLDADALCSKIKQLFYQIMVNDRNEHADFVIAHNLVPGQVNTAVVGMMHVPAYGGEIPGITSLDELLHQRRINTVLVNVDSAPKDAVMKYMV